MSSLVLILFLAGFPFSSTGLAAVELSAADGFPAHSGEEQHREIELDWDEKGEARNQA